MLNLWLADDGFPVRPAGYCGSSWLEAQWMENVTTATGKNRELWQRLDAAVALMLNGTGSGPQRTS